MPAITRESRTAAPATAQTYDLKISAYERTSGLLVALLIMVGLSVAILFVIWLTNQIFARPLAVPVLLENIGTGGGQGSGLADSVAFDDAQPEELMQDLGEFPLAPPMALALLDSTIAENQSTLSDLTSTSDEPSSGQGGTGGGEGGAGGGSGGEPGIPRWQRWEVRFEPGLGLTEYAEQLDYFGVELGIVGNSNSVTYVTQLSSPSPKTRQGSGADEDRLYMAWRSGELELADQQLLRRAGISTEGGKIVHFYSADLENQMAVLERDFAGRKATEIRRTRFGVREDGADYEMYVIDQTPL